MSIQMGSYQKLNDPREAKSWPFTFYTRNHETNEKFNSSIFDDISNYITKKSLVLCCTRDDPTVNKNDEDFDTRTGYGHPRMWSQYADRHKGVCLVLNQESLNSDIKEKAGGYTLFRGPVLYLKTAGPVGDAYHIQYLDDILDKDIASVMEPHIEKHNKSLFFTKHLDWRAEWEYRWVLRSTDDAPILIPITSSIKGIILGNECTANDTKDILAICSELTILVFKLFQHGWSMSLMPTDAKEENVISLNGISFSTLIPTSGVFAQAHDSNGNIRPIHINNSGQVIVVE